MVGSRPQEWCGWNLTLLRGGNYRMPLKFDPADRVELYLQETGYLCSQAHNSNANRLIDKAR